MSDFIRSNQKLDDAVLGSKTFEEMREAMLQTLAGQGVITRDSSDAYGVRVNPDSPALARPEVSMPAGQRGTPTHMRVVYPMGNARFEIMGMSDADLDAQEAHILQRYSH